MPRMWRRQPSGGLPVLSPPLLGPVPTPACSNIFFLYIFGKAVEEEEGAAGVWLTYLVTGRAPRRRTRLAAPTPRPHAPNAPGPPLPAQPAQLSGLPQRVSPEAQPARAPRPPRALARCRSAGASLASFLLLPKTMGGLLGGAGTRPARPPSAGAAPPAAPGRRGGARDATAAAAAPGSGWRHPTHRGRGHPSMDPRRSTGPRANAGGMAH